jgi:hypothetical protein
MRKEDQAGAIRARRRQGERHRLAKKTIRHLEQDAGAVAGIRIGAAGAAVFEVDQEIESRTDDGVRADTFDVGDKANAAGVVLVAWAVQALGPLITVFHDAIKGAIQT